MKGFNADLIPHEYRGLEGLTQWCKDSLEADDCDSAMWMLNDLYERYEHNIEQKLWVAWLYGNCYWAPTAWILWNEFPDQDLVDPERLERWHKDNWRLLNYQVDCKWSKGHLPRMYESYYNWLNGRTQQEAIKDDFNYMWGEITGKWFKFGRYSAWFYLQTLNETCNYSFDVPSLWLSDYSGSRSHRNGACISVKRYDWIDARLSEGEYERLEKQMEEVRQEVGCTRFQLETMLCSYKKLARARDSRYIGYYTDRQKKEIEKSARTGFVGIDWTPWEDARLARGLSKLKLKDEQITLF